MRTAGTIDSAQDLHAGDHLCWVYEDRTDLSRAVVQFLGEGLSHGERVSFVAGHADDAFELIRPLGDLEELVRRDALSVTLTSESYPATPAETADQAEVYAEATRRAVTDGFRGLRVAADATSLVIEPAAREAFARYEQLIDRRMGSLPFTAMCAYDATVLGDVATDLACLHPATNVEAPFHLCAAADGTPVLLGEVDAACTDRFTVAAAGVVSGDGVTRIDGSALSFIDHRGLMVLDALAGNGSVELVTPFGGAGRVVEVLGLQRIAVIPVG